MEIPISDILNYELYLMSVTDYARLKEVSRMTVGNWINSGDVDYVGIELIKGYPGPNNYYDDKISKKNFIVMTSESIKLKKKR